MRAILVVASMTICLFLMSSCTPENSDRCGDDFEFDETAGVCKEPVEDTSDSADDTGSDSQMDTDGTDYGVDGMGETCVTNADCADYEADFCALDPTTMEAACVLTDCSISPNDCPGILLCCQLPTDMGFPSMCIPPEQYADIAELCGGGGAQ